MADEFLKLVFKGDKDARKAFENLEGYLQAKAVRPALRFGAKLVASEARSLVPVDEGTLEESIGVRSGRRSRRNPGRLTVNAVVGERQADDFGAFWAGFVNFGTVKQEADQYMTQAFETTYAAASERVAIEILRALSAARWPSDRPGAASVLKRKHQLPQDLLSGF